MSESTSPAVAPLRIGPIELSSPVVLAPMAGITNTAFRRLCREYGAGLYVTEMVTSRALVERAPRACASSTTNRMRPRARSSSTASTR